MGIDFFAGNSLAQFGSTNVATAHESTTVNTFDSAYVSNSLVLPGGTEILTSAPFSATGTIWWRLSQYVDYNPSVNSGNGPALYNGTTPVFRLAPAGTGQTWQPQYWNGSAWVSTGTTVIYTQSLLTIITVQIILGSGFTLFRGGVEITSGSGWVGGGTTVTNVRLYNPNASVNSARFSEIMVSNYDNRDAHTLAVPLTGNSAVNTGGTGSYTDINEIVTSDATSETVIVAGNVMGQVLADIVLPTGYRINSAVIAARGMVSGGIVTNGQLGFRSGGANTPSASLGYGSGLGPAIAVFANNPATGTPWTEATINAAESFMKGV